jgi:uncharacterized protein (DUF983 family)
MKGSEGKGLYEYKTSPMMTGIPKYNRHDKKTEVPKDKKQRRRFRCPQCGRGSIFPRKLTPHEEKDNNTIGRKDSDG